MKETRPLRSRQRTQSREDLSSIKKNIDIARAAFEAASEVLNMLEGMELETLISSEIDCDVDFYELVRSFEINLIRRALLRANGNQTIAAGSLKMRVSTLNNKIRVFDIHQEAHFLTVATKTGNRRSMKRTKDDLVA